MARVNIVKRIKSDGRWVMRSVPKKPNGEWDWKTLPEGRYYVEWYDEGARRREQAGSTVAQALEVQRRKKHQIDGLQLGLVSTRKLAPPPPVPIDTGRALRVLINRYLDQVDTLKKPNTYRKYAAVLDRFADYFKDRQFESVSTDELNDFVVHLKKSGMEANTVLHNVVIIAQFFKRSGRGGIMRQLHLPERTTSLPVAYTDEELEKFFVACDDFHRALYSTFLMTGFREQEVMLFRLLLTGLDDSAVTEDAPLPTEAKPNVERPSIRPDVLAQMISDYEDELAQLAEKPDALDAQETAIEEQLDELQASLATMEGRLSQTSQQRKEVYDRYGRLTARNNEITELHERFRLLDAQYTNDIKRLGAIEESGQFFVLRDPMACPLCGAQPQGQNHDAACDGNVAAVTQAAAAETAKIRLLQSELHGTIAALTTEQVEVVTERKSVEREWRKYQQQIETALSPDFSEARKKHAALVEKRSQVQQAIVIYKRIQNLKRRLDEPKPTAAPEKPIEKEDAPDVEQYIPKTALGAFSKIVEQILNEWHFPDATNVYFDEGKRDVVIGDRSRGSRGAGLCAITYSAFTLALFEYCRSRKMPHPGFVILDSPLIAYKEPKIEDEGIAGTDLKPRFYEYLESFVGEEQIFIVDNTDPPAAFIPKATHFTKNPKIPRYGLFPDLKKPAKP